MNDTKTTDNIFKELSSIDISKNAKEKPNKKGEPGLKYLSWTYAWASLKSKHPSANYEVREFDGRPYLHDENLGYLVETSVTVNNETIKMRLPVLDGANKAMHAVRKEYTTKYGKKTIEPASMQDINTAIMRCLTKNIAMFGLGISLYNGEDLDFVLQEKQKEKIEAIKEMSLQIKEAFENNSVEDHAKIEKWMADKIYFIDPAIVTFIQNGIDNFYIEKDNIQKATTVTELTVYQNLLTSKETINIYNIKLDELRKKLDNSQI